MGRAKHKPRCRAAGRTEQLAEYLAKSDQTMLPFCELVENAQIVVDQLIEEAGRAMIEAVLEMSANQVAGPRHQGKAAGPVRRHGHQPGSVALAERKVPVMRPRVRHIDHGELPIPAYETMRSVARMGRRMTEILMRGVSTRNYRGVLPEMAEAAGVSKSTVSRRFVAESERRLRELCERRFDDRDIVALVIDGVVIGRHVVVVVLGVDAEGGKLVLGLREGSTESAAVIKDLLRNLIDRGLSVERKRLIVSDGSKGIYRAVNEILGADNPHQRCRNHKIMNVIRYLPKPLKPHVACVMKAAYKLDADEGMRRLKEQAKALEFDYPGAAASLLEGIEDTFTVNRLGLPPKLARALATTNLVENVFRHLRRRIDRVCRMHGGRMVLRWAATALLNAEEHFKPIWGTNEMWILVSALEKKIVDSELRAA